MKTRTLGLVAGIVLVAASAGFSQAAGMDKKAETNAVSAASGVPAILGSFDNAATYQAINKQEMKNIQGESTYIRYISLLTGKVVGYTRISRWPRRWNLYINVAVL
ncbi:MAG: hypothetical protein D3917_09295 [Candidatus Electrothrix sp. AX5]|nr:hypothetical protein [Candidatus Electrothrix sp. AX5]